MTATFLRRLDAAWPPRDWRRVTVLLAVSGGADSVALLRGLRELKPVGGGRLVVAHFNHQLRGADSDADEAFVLDLATRLGLECRTGHPKSPLASRRDGLEAAAREARYQFLVAAAREQGARFIATAHTADDQAETIVQRILRGTGLAGLAGMRRARELEPGITLIRPLLDFSRDSVTRFLAGIEQPFREDPSNEDRQHTRNRIRHELLPLLAADYNPRVVEAVLRLGSIAADTNSILDEMSSQVLRRCLISQSADQLEIDTRALRDVPPALAREMFLTLWRRQRWPMRSMSRQTWDQLATAAQSGGVTPPPRLPGGVRVRRQDERLVFEIG